MASDFEIRILTAPPQGTGLSMMFVVWEIKTTYKILLGVETFKNEKIWSLNPSGIGLSMVFVVGKGGEGPFVRLG